MFASTVGYRISSPDPDERMTILTGTPIIPCTLRKLSFDYPDYKQQEFRDDAGTLFITDAKGTVADRDWTFKKYSKVLWISASGRFSSDNYVFIATPTDPIWSGFLVLEDHIL